MKLKYAQYLIKKTRDDYEKIAKFFFLKRRFFWPELEKIKDYIKDGDKVLDFGCGHGRLLLPLKNKKINYIGVDSSSKILKIAKKSFPEHEFKILNKLSLPFPDSLFNVICCIAAIHHIPSKNFRLKLLKEFERTIKKDGFLILTVWYLWKGKKKIIFRYILKWFLDKTRCLVFRKKPGLDFRDLFIPWKDEKGKIITNRYFHAFSKRELAKLVKKSGFKIKKLEIVKRGKNLANILIVATK